jgi:HlyD family secretion protein
MKHKGIWIAAAGVVVAAAVTWAALRSARSAAPGYRLATLERGNVESIISATGKLGAVTTVQVGTQVSGQVSAIYADFNQHVKKGQLIARIDPTLQQQAVREAEAGLGGTQAGLDKAAADHARDTKLHDRQMISDIEFSVSTYALAMAQANAKSGQVALERARRNLAYTSIYAPIDGIVIERNVDVGQTVAASLSAPQIFLIANDLSQMQILASVDESDVGQIHEGMAAHFTVQADPKETFTGVVRQLRLQSTTTENVVNYTVVVAAKNPDGKLLPGMTATVAFLTGSATGVFTVPNAALRLRPTPAMLAQTGSPGAGGTPEAAASPRPAGARAARNGQSGSLLWYVGADGKLATTRVRVGISDGQKTEVEGASLTAGMKVVIGTSSGSTSASPAASSPFQQQSSSGPPGPRGGF